MRTRALTLAALVCAAAIPTGCASGDLTYGAGRYESLHASNARKWRAHLGRPEPAPASIEARRVARWGDQPVVQGADSAPTGAEVLGGIIWGLLRGLGALAAALP